MSACILWEGVRELRWNERRTAAWRSNRQKICVHTRPPRSTLRAETYRRWAACLHVWPQGWQPGPQHGPKWPPGSLEMLGWISLHFHVPHIWSSCTVLMAGGGRFNADEERVMLGYVWHQRGLQSSSCSLVSLQHFFEKCCMWKIK